MGPPFGPDHEDARHREFEKVDACAGIQHGAELDAAPRLVARVCGRTGGVHDEEEEGEPEGERERDRGAVDAEAGVVDEIDVERDVDGGEDDEHVCGRVHDPLIEPSSVGRSRHEQRHRTLTLEVFLEAFKADVARCGEQQQAKILLGVPAQLFFLAERHEHLRHVRPHDADGHEEEPEHRDAPLEMDGEVRGVLAARERLGAQRVQRGGSTQRDTPPCIIMHAMWDHGYWTREGSQY